MSRFSILCVYMFLAETRADCSVFLFIRNTRRLINPCRCLSSQVDKTVYGKEAEAEPLSHEFLATGLHDNPRA